MADYRYLGMALQDTQSLPQYGGDCTLKQDGLASSLARLEDVTGKLNSLTWQLREQFAMSVPEDSAGQATVVGPKGAGPKGAIDRSVSSSNASINNIELILEHLRS